MTQSDPSNLSRRSFVKHGAAGIAATAAAANLGFLSSSAYAQEAGQTIKIGIIGCGGRGTGALRDCFNAAGELGLKAQLVAVADVAAERANVAKQTVQKSWGDQGGYAVTDDTTFVGMDGYKKLCALPDVDVVIQATPPGLRYLTLREAVKNGKHSFVEKPVCVDSDTYRSVLESGKIASEKGLAIVSGTQYRREASYVEAIKALNDGIIGEITASYQYYCAGTLWYRGNGGGQWSPMEYQMRNWLYYPWLSGDLIAEQSIHNIDAINWSMGGPPAKAYASGGRISRIAKEFGTVYDHFDVHYEWANGVRSSFMGRQYKGARNKVENRWIGTGGTLSLGPNTSWSGWRATDFDGNELARSKPSRGNARSSYVEEHKALLGGVVNNEPVMEIQEVADSSLTCILGREAAYTGQEITFEDLAKAKLKLRPEGIDQGPKPGPVNLPFPDIRRPGTYKLA